MNQLRKAFKVVSNTPETDTVIFAGDLNLTDLEVKSDNNVTIQMNR